MDKLIGDIKALLGNGKVMITVGVVIVLVTMFIASKPNVAGDGNDVDNSNKVTISNDTLSDNAVKIGDIENTQGDIIIKK